MIGAREVGAVDEHGQQIYQQQDAARWTLLTTLHRERDGYSVKEIVSFYALRWRIEQFHFVLKSGALNMERRQFDDVFTFINAPAFYSIIAWRLPELNYMMGCES